MISILKLMKGVLYGNGEHHEKSKQTHIIIIIGAGLTGLLLAQELRKLNARLEAEGRSAPFTFSIHERDKSSLYRGGGFSLTIHWALQQLYDILPEELSARIFECVGNPDAIENGQMEPALKTTIPPGWKAARMSRVRFLQLLMTDLNIHYSHRLSQITFPTDDTVRAHFENGDQEAGDLLIGADGANSVVRRFVYGAENPKNTQLPICMLDCRSEYPLKELEACLRVDPYLFHAGDPVQDGYFIFAFLDMPPPGSKDGKAGVQLTISWPYEPGYLGQEAPSDPPTELPEQLAWLKRMAKHWANPVHDLIYGMPDDSIVRVIRVQEWTPNDANRRPTDGKITTVGDAADLMTSFRGENANHGVVDVTKLLALLAPSGNKPTDFKEVPVPVSTDDA
ncbi:hypothetical protein BDV23DRAFT_171898 [Aspergillus alliaceus]|uniref:FAD-binding domain-containing protein n=1 Tax=Petromyces alliaceus TaxID=209559 RepID=A0A5N7CB52_PETAA|nr:hypothetical protein BDV23DRAFT_171898 [Aspergillus alliaceus]